MTRLTTGMPMLVLGLIGVAGCGQVPPELPGGSARMTLPDGLRAPDGLLAIQRWRELAPMRERLRKQNKEELPPVETLKRDVPDRLSPEEAERRLVRIPRRSGGPRGRGGSVLGEDPPDVVGFGGLAGCGPAWNAGFGYGDAWCFQPYGWGGNLYMIPYALVGGYYVPAYVPFYYEAGGLLPYQDLPLAYGTTPLVPQYVTTLSPFVGGVTPPVAAAGYLGGMPLMAGGAAVPTVAGGAPFPMMPGGAGLPPMPAGNGMTPYNGQFAGMWPGQPPVTPGATPPGTASVGGLPPGMVPPGPAPLRPAGGIGWALGR